MTAELQPIIVKANVIADSQIVKAEVATEIRASGSDIPAYTGEYTITPNEQAQVLETNGTKLLDDVTVEAIPSEYVGSTVPRKTAQTYTPTTSDQTIPSGQYLTGVQTLKGDSALVAENIKKDAEIFGVRGSFEGGITPVGAIDISENGDFDVSTFATARVAVPWNWIGKEAELLKTYQFGTISLAETTYPSWTPSNTASNIRSAEIIDNVDADMDEYEYVIIYNHDARIVYQQETQLKAALLRVCSKKAYEIHHKPSDPSDLEAGEYGYNYCSLLFGGGLTVYVDNSGARKLFWDSYGIYINPVAVAFSYNKAAKPKLIIRSPHVVARCNNTYFDISMASEVDVDNTTITYSAELYRVKRGVAWSIYNDLVNRYRS